MLKRLSNSVAIREGEGRVALLMFAYSFLAMTAHNILKPLTRSKFIADLGADNLPYVQLAAGILIGVLMHGYSQASRRVPRQALIPSTQALIVAVLLALWVLLQTGAAWVTVAFYFLSLILGVLLISQFWTLANDIYDARQAKRLFGFIGGGSSLGGAVGAGLTAGLVERIGANSLVLVSAVVLGACAGLVVVVGRHRTASASDAGDGERGVGGREAMRLLTESKHLRVLALVVGCAAAGASVVEQQLNMAAEALRGGASGDAIAAFLAEITVYISVAGFLVQVALTSRIHRSLGIGFALLILPVGLGAGGSLVLATGALWAVGAARVLDSTLRYTVDKTTREVLFLPLPVELKYRAKPFIDVTADRVSKALGAVVTLVLIKPWGFGLDWRQLSYASLGLMAVWVVAALAARRQYLRAFRDSIGIRRIEPEHVRTEVADGATVEALVEELASPDTPAVLYAIDMLEAVGKPNLISPLLLQHASSGVRVRALRAVASTRTGKAGHWTSTVERMVRDDDIDVRAAALQALAELSAEDSVTVLRQYLDDAEARVAVAAARVLGVSSNPVDVEAADRTLSRVIGDGRATAADGRRQAAAALAGLGPRFRPLLVPLMWDPDVRVAEEAIRSAREMGAVDGLFIPGLISLLGHRELKGAAREALVGYGEDAVGPLVYVLHDRREAAWVRRHIPATLARIPGPASFEALVASLDDPDGFLRFKVIEAIEAVRRAVPSATVPSNIIEARIVQETSRYANYLTLRENVRRECPGDEPPSLLARALDEKAARAIDRTYRLIGLVHGSEEIAGIRHAIDTGDQKRRAGALEYLDNVLTGAIRAKVMPFIDDRPLEDKVRRANLLLKTRPRDLADTIAQLIHDGDDVVAATAIHFAERRGIPDVADDLAFVAERKPTPHVRLARETAAWALACRAGKAARGAETSRPVVELVDRIRAIPVLASVTVDELFRMVGTGHELRHQPERELYQRGSDTTGVFFLTEGTVAELHADGWPRERRAPALLGFEDVLRGTPASQTVRALDDVASIRVAAADFVTLVSDSPALAQGLFRTLLTTDTGEALPIARSWPSSAGTGSGRVASTTSEEVLLLRKDPFLQKVTADAALALIAATEERSFTAGDALVDAGHASATYLVLQGAVTIVTGDAPSQRVGVGGTIGLAETLAGAAAPWTLRGASDGVVRRLSHDALFGVLADHVGLLQDLFGAVLDARASAPPAADDLDAEAAPLALP